MKVRTVLTLSVAAMLLGVLMPSTSMAIPAWARKYGASCNLCHYPNVPRLNSYGERYRRAGFRTQDEMNKDQEITQVGNFLAVRGRVQYRADFPDHGNFSNAFRLNDVTIFYAGPVSKHFSAFTETSVNQDGAVEVLGTAHGILGEWGNFATIRVGQMHTLTRVGFGGLDRPTGISTSPVLANNLTRNGVPFKLNEDQRGLELSYVFRDSRFFAQVLNGVNGTGNGRPSANDTDQDKDFVLAFEQIIDDIASGVTVFGYRGAVHVPSPGGPSTRFSFWRYGVTGNKVVELGPINFEVQGGFVRSDDDVPTANTTVNDGRDISGNAFFIQLEQYLRELNFTLFERYDYINPQVGHSDDEVQFGTLGVVAPLEEYVRVALEGSIINRAVASPKNDTNDYRILTEVMFNF